MFIRSYKPSDCKSMAELFHDTIQVVTVSDYTAEQRSIWASGMNDLEKWNTSFLKNRAIVALDNGCITGFGDINDTGYLDMLYVHKDYQRQGIATAICDKLETGVKGSLITTHASITARPFFEKRGYRVEKEQQVERQGILLTNFVMVKVINNTAADLCFAEESR